MLWNECDYELQERVLLRISFLISQEKNLEIKDGLIAAINELEIWSNHPCLGFEDDRLRERELPKVIVQADGINY